ncbi:response regulator transcription factor [Parapedobacter sp. ISTM3]|uniref:response regulator transcription factor n=1 Tax=Parapedobacter sp. ISTM3 TaxID=2800130 RepID=UPI001906C8E3|nr:response regulator transcription factor [Parapedobacter sp. ISTM3]MBK1439327.1 response regulator transcription factor [Parapedobacter sp. ISTM3]
MNRILIIEDDDDISMQLQGYLHDEGFLADVASNGIEARERLRRDRYDVLVVDIMMPYEDGFTFVEKLRQTETKIPFVFVTAKNQKEDVIKGLMLGADDYIRKPFDPDELVLRVRNLLARTLNPTGINKEDRQVRIGDYLFDLENLSLTYKGKQSLLTEKEAKLLAYLCQNEGRVIRRDEILQRIWKENDFFSGRSMDVFMTRLRKYLSHDKRIQIESVRGVGFRFVKNRNN